MQRIIGLTCLLIASISLVVACGDDRGGGGSGTRSITLEQVPQEYAEIVCGRVFSCCNEQERQEALQDIGATTEAECRTNMKAMMEQQMQQTTASIDAGRAEFQGDKAGICMQALEDASCAEGLIPEGDDVQPAECDEVVAGLVEEGGECASSSECKVGDCQGAEYDDNGNVTAMGTCSTGAKIGESCEWSGDCEEGAYCDSHYDSETEEFVGECKKIGELGDPCSSNSQACVEGLYCNAEYDQATGETVGTCAEIGDVGDSCSGFDGCVESAYCETYDPATGESPNVCKAKKGAGEGCDFGECNDSTYCKENDSGTPTDYYGTCTTLKADGEPCESSSECASDWCGSSGSDPDAPDTCVPEDGGSGDAMCTGN